MMQTQPPARASSEADVIGAGDPLGRSLMLNRCSFLQPLRLEGPLGWAGHIPFAFFLVSVLRPKMIAELGTHFGLSYFAFCQIVDHLGLPTRCYAVDTWQGDKHAGRYGENVYLGVRQYNEDRYARFSRLIRSTFDEALPHFPDASIDLLHIDGLHTYEAVRHDFESWRPKLSRQAVVLLHDTNVRELDFEVHRLWAEIAPQFPSFELWHSHGLGVLGVGDRLSDAMRELFAALQSKTVAQDTRMAYAVLGNALESRAMQSRSTPPPLPGKRIARLKKKVRRLLGAKRPASC